VCKEWNIETFEHINKVYTILNYKTLNICRGKFAIQIGRKLAYSVITNLF